MDCHISRASLLFLSFSYQGFVFNRTRRQPASTHVKVESVKNRNNHLFSHVTSGHDVAIGPLEYYGNAFIYKAAGGYHK